ncbi:hypothetical protein X737_27425 [Mesorhizobium sp. L48C026A00]|nr:hypothetical protein X737_27425 [Mesorhizobium sp. L48C026A00]
MKHLFADAYDRLKLIRGSDEKGFEVLPRRWVVERTFGWMTRWRRLVSEYEKRIDVSHAMILVARRRSHPRRLAESADAPRSARLARDPQRAWLPLDVVEAELRHVAGPQPEGAPRDGVFGLSPIFG